MKIFELVFINNLLIFIFLHFFYSTFSFSFSFSHVFHYIFWGKMRKDAWKMKGYVEYKVEY